MGQITVMGFAHTVRPCVLTKKWQKNKIYPILKITLKPSNFKFLGQYFIKSEDDKYTVLTQRPSIYSVKQCVVATSRYCSHLLPSHSLDTTIFERESLHNFGLFSYQLQTTN